MMIPVSPVAPAVSMSRRRSRKDVLAAGEESPDSIYIRDWMARQARRHHDLLLTIVAASAPRPRIEEVPQ